MQTLEQTGTDLDIADNNSLKAAKSDENFEFPKQKQFSKFDSTYLIKYKSTSTFVVACVTDPWNAGQTVKTD